MTSSNISLAPIPTWKGPKVIPTSYQGYTNLNNRSIPTSYRLEISLGLA
jgi:hypothetical protein